MPQSDLLRAAGNRFSLFPATGAVMEDVTKRRKGRTLGRDSSTRALKWDSLYDVALITRYLKFAFIDTEGPKRSAKELVELMLRDPLPEQPGCRKRTGEVKLISEIKKTLLLRYGINLDEVDHAAARAMVSQIVHHGSMIDRAGRSLPLTLGGPSRVIRVLCTPSVATSYMPKVLFELRRKDWFRNFQDTQLRVELCSDNEQGLYEVACEQATCLFAENDARSLANQRGLTIAFSKLFPGVEHGFIYSSQIAFPAKTSIRRIEDLTFLERELVWEPIGYAGWDSLERILPKPNPTSGGARCALYTFNAIRAAVYRAGGVGVGVRWRESCVWGRGPEGIKFFPFSDLPDWPEAEPLKRDRHDLYLCTKEPLPGNLRDDGIESSLSPEMQVMRAIMNEADDYVHTFVT